MKWIKLGRVFSPTGESDWMATHAANPCAEHIRGNYFRIYFSSRDADSRSSIGYVEIDITEPNRVLNLSKKPLISPGSAGLFDDSGTSMACIANDGNGNKFLYYLGWNLAVTVPFRNTIGLAICKKGSEDFAKVSRAPVMDRADCDPFCLSYPWVIRQEQKWRMWYGSNLLWGKDTGSMVHVIKYAESFDGIVWHRSDVVCVPLQHEREIAISRPCVVVDETRHRMWYSYRGDTYRIGYAESSDGLTWQRLDHEVGIEPSSEGWDSQSMAYPCVFKHNGRLFMLYNGNGYGLTGFGIAVLA